MVSLMMLLICISLIAAVVFAIRLIQKDGLSTKAPSQIILREGEVLFLSTQVVWLRKKFYWNRYNVPNGILDITNQRVVYTWMSGEKREFALEKADIKEVRKAAGIRVDLLGKDGNRYSINTMPAKDTLAAFQQMGVPVQF